MNPVIQQSGFDQTEIAELLALNRVLIDARPTKSTTPNHAVVRESGLCLGNMIGFVGMAVLGHIPGQFLQTDYFEFTQGLYVLQGAGEIDTAVTRFSRLHIPGKDPHLFDAGMHKRLNKLALEDKKQYQ